MNTRLVIENNTLKVQMTLDMKEVKFLTALVAENHEGLFKSEDEMWQSSGDLIAKLQHLGTLGCEAQVLPNALIFGSSDAVTQG